ncbi:MAG: permease [Actinomycetota bacterium]|nr:permease [Actinomycetota bacterium]
MGSALWQSLGFFVVLMTELAVLFIVVSVLVGLLQEYVSEKTIQRALTRRWGMGNVLGAASGALTPFCSFSTIPVMVGLLRVGAPFGAVASFLLASPLVNPVVLGLFLVLFGWRVTVVYTLLGFVLAVASGVLWEKFGLEKYVKRLDGPEESVESQVEAPGKSLRSRLRRAARVGWTEFRRALPYLVAGVAVGAVIYGFVPTEIVARVAGPQNPLAIPVAAAVGAPLYIWPETMLPIGAALLEKGMGIGAIMALVIGGAGASIPEVSVLASVFKSRLLIFFLATVLTIAVVVGYTFSVLF